jgi:hypothetical protein
MWLFSVAKVKAPFGKIPIQNEAGYFTFIICVMDKICK